MKQKQGVTTQRTLVALALAFGFAGGAWAHQSPQCGSNVSRQGKVITVKPTGISDTKNLQCAIDLAVAGGRGSVVQLTRGTFHTAQLVAKNLKGTIRGEGIKHTVLQNLPNLMVAPDNFPLSPPSAQNPWSMLLTVDGGDVGVSDLAIQIVGAEPTTGYKLTAFGIPADIVLKSLSAAVAATGTRPRLRVARISVAGELAPNDLFYGVNLYNGTIFQGGLGPGSELAGSYEVRDSRFSTLASGTPAANVKDAVIVMENNTYDAVNYSLAEVADITNTDVRMTNNRGTAYLYGINVTTYSFQANGFTDSRVFIAHNTIKGEGTAININGAVKFAGKTNCQIVFNDTTRVKKLPAILLGTGTKDCLVITHEAGTVKNLGTNNRIITVPRR